MDSNEKREARWAKTDVKSKVSSKRFSRKRAATVGQSHSGKREF